MSNVEKTSGDGKIRPSPAEVSKAPRCLVEILFRGECRGEIHWLDPTQIYFVGRLRQAVIFIPDITISSFCATLSVGKSGRWQLHRLDTEEVIEPSNRRSIKISKAYELRFNISK